MDLRFLLFSLLTFTIFFLFFLFKQLAVLKTSKKKPIPGPWKLPLIGNILNMVGSLPHHVLRDLAKKYGPIMHLQLGEISTVVITSPLLAKEILKTHDLAFVNKQELLATKVVFYNCQDIAFSPHGEYWRQMRKLCSSELLSAKKVKSFGFIREEETGNLVESIQSSLGLPINLSKKIFSCTNAIVSRAVFGNGACKDHDDALNRLLGDTLRLMGGFDVADLFPSIKLLQSLTGMRSKLKSLHHELDKLFDNIIDEHAQQQQASKSTSTNMEEEDLLDILLRLKDSGGLEVPITTTNIKAIIMDVFAAGNESSSSTVVWAMSEMIRKPRVMEKAQAELREALMGKKYVSEIDVKGLSYLKMVVKETLRLHPPGPLLSPRICREEHNIGGYVVPVKTKVLVNAWAIARDPNYWDDPESFEPERFENSSVDFTGNDFEYLPFGAGRRMCPGISFAIANVELLLAKLLYHFNWELPDGKPQDLDMTESLGIAAIRKTNLCLLATSYYSDPI